MAQERTRERKNGWGSEGKKKVRIQNCEGKENGEECSGIRNGIGYEEKEKEEDERIEWHKRKSRKGRRKLNKEWMEEAEEKD